MKGLLDRWDDDGFPRDKASGVFFERMHRLEHRGKHFNVRDPLDVGPIPQRHIPIFTAGDSANSQELAARHADVVYGGQPDLASARTYYASLMGRLARRGRTPDELLVMPGIMPFIGRTMQEAQDKLVHHQCRRRLQYPGALHPRGREGFRRAGDPRAAAPRPVPH